MEHVIGRLLQDFEVGKLIQTLALGVTAGPAALAAAQKPAEKSSTTEALTDDTCDPDRGWEQCGTNIGCNLTRRQDGDV